MVRDTRTGGVFERMILPALGQGGYRYEKHVLVGTRLGGRRHLVDLVVSTPGGERIPISLKWQQTSGTAEQKIPFEILCLSDALHHSSGKFTKAYVVLGGPGWTLREFYTSGKIREYLKNCEQVFVVSLETFVAKANAGKL